MRKVADASGAKYAGGPSTGSSGPPPPIKAKPVFSPGMSSAGRSVNPLVAARSRRDDNVDDDGWGADAPPVTRTEVERVQSAYKPTKVELPGLGGRQSETSRYSAPQEEKRDVVGGGYQPVGKVDIAAIRAQAKEQRDDRPTIVKGAYEPVGKVDIAAIRAKAQKPAGESPSVSSPAADAPVEEEAPKPLADRASAFSQPAQPERLTSMPKPKVANKFGGGGFSGTKAPTPGALGLQGPVASASSAPVTTTSRTFANEGGKTPAQLWAEKKARERGSDVGAAATPSSPPPVTQQSSGNNEWKSGYAGKSWATVQTPAFGRGGAETVRENDTGVQEEEPAHGEEESSGGVAAMRDRFKGAAPMGGAPPVPGAGAGHRDEPEEEEEQEAPPPPPAASRPSGGFALPGLPTRPPPVDDEEEEEAEQERDESPIRVAQPVAREAEPPVRAPAPPPAPVPAPREPTPEPEPEPEPEPAPAPPPAPVSHQAPPPAPAPAAAAAASQRAVILYDYEKDEDNEINLTEGEVVSDIDQVDPDWWIGTNVHGENGLFPSSYVELIEDDGAGAGAAPAPPPSAPTPAASAGPTATALYDYEAAEDNGMSHVYPLYQ